MLAIGEPIPDAQVWTGPRESTSLSEVAAGKPMLLLFYPFAWSGT